MKEKVKCKKCGLLIDKDSNFCPYCGYDQTKEEKTTIDVNPSDIIDANGNAAQLKRARFTDFKSQALDLNWVKSLIFFLFGFLGLKLIAYLLQIIAVVSSNWYFLASGAASSAINFSCYIMLFGGFLIFAGKDITKFFKDFKENKTLLYGLGFGFLLMIASSTVSSLMNLIRDSGVNDNEAAIDSITTSFPLLSLIIFGILGPICEEFTYRLGLFTLLKRWNRVAAYILTAVIFGFIHFNFLSGDIVGELINIPSYIVAGVLLCYFYDYKGIGASMIAHITNNFIAIGLQILLSSLN